MADQQGHNSDHHNHGGMLAFIFSMTFVLAFFVYLVFIHPGVDLNEKVKDVAAAETAAVEVAVDVSKITEPWVANQDMVKHGKKIYAQNCAMCHGDAGMGDGAAGASLNPKPRNLVDGPWKKGGGFIGLFTVVTEGLPGTSMAAYGNMKPVDRWALVQFIDSITKAKVQEDAAKVAEFAKAAK